MPVPMISDDREVSRMVQGFVTVLEMKDILGVTREYMYRLMKSDPNFPKPWTFPKSKFRMWERGEVVRYSKERNRKRGPRR